MPAALFTDRPDLAQIADAVTQCAPSRDDLLLLAGMQARTAVDALAAGDAAAARALLHDAMDFLNRAVEARS